MNCYQLITFEKTVIFLVTLYLCVRVSVCVHSFYENVVSWRCLSWSDNKCLSFLVFSLSFELFFCLCLVDKFNIVFNYDNRFDVRIGDDELLDFKIKVFEKVVVDFPNDTGRITISENGKAVINLDDF